MPTQLNNITDETRDELAALALNLSGNAKTRKGFLGLVKEVSPATPIPELEVDSRIAEAIKPFAEKAEKAERDLQEYKLGNDLAAKRAAVREKHGLDDAAMAKIEERMGKKELPTDYEWAARLHKQEMEVATPTTYGTPGFNGPLNIHGNAEEFKGLMENESQWSQQTAHSIIDDMLKKGRAPNF